MDKKIFATLFLSLFATITGVGIVVPLLPVYAHSIGARGIYISLIFGAFSISRTIFLSYFGRLSDLKGRKPLILTGLIGYSLISIAFIYAQDIYSIISLRFLQGIASAMLMPVILAYVGDLTPKGKEGYYMGLFNLSVFGSLSIGPILGGVINDFYNMKATFICMGVLSILSCAFAYFFLPKTEFEKKNIKESNTKTSIKNIFREGNFRYLFFYRLTYTTNIGIIWAFLPVYASSEFFLSSSEIGILLMLGVLLNGILQTPVGYLADKTNKNILIFIGSVIMIISLYLYEISTEFQGLFLASILFGLGGGIAVPAMSALSVIIGDKTKSMGTVMALLTTAHSLGMLLGSLLAGVIMEIFELRFAFQIGAWIMAGGTFFYLFCSRSNSINQ